MAYSSSGQWKQKYPVKPVPKKVKFEGWSKDLKGNIFGISSGLHTDKLNKTFREICENVVSTYIYRSDARRALEILQTPTILIPSDPQTNVIKTENKCGNEKLTCT